ncbi:MmgE/PrpD family protein [Muricoccus pecuniae]|uniref:2-methylcitrate dehydratase PrpD n=1 Tax=Muricoccus pecuniae TaxID=693023 RepID=A0A840Y6K6_9PROT|nr:MmgE/PrpD family protein [Roseomonas pecuniae]MBB5691997.1 2-methylcitrate dehydratase PrpD [Roseomonas pecuniae]
MSARLPSDAAPASGRRLEAVADRDEARPLARQAAEAALAQGRQEDAVVSKVQTCLLDVIGAALESRHLPWGDQAVRIASPSPGGVRIIGASRRTTPGDAAFANAALAHGLVREDMHAASISHLGVVVIPALLSLAQTRRVDGGTFVAAVVAGYEVGARIGAALFTTELARLFRPTGITGPIGAAAGAARLLGLDPARATSAIALAANATGGLNEWPAVGGNEMFFHPGFAARNAVTAAQLAEFGAEASETALDGPAGLFAAMRRDGTRPRVSFFGGRPEILAVYNKPVPACNFAQTACQVALRLSREHAVRAEELRGVRIRVPRAAARYPGCDSTGPFDRLLQAKMSIPFGVAATLCRGVIEEANYTLPVSPDVARLIGLTSLKEDEALTAAFPARQGAAIELLLDGRTLAGRLDDVVAATPGEVRARCERAATDALGAKAAQGILDFVDGLPEAADVGAIGELFAAAEEVA